MKIILNITFLLILFFCTGTLSHSNSNSDFDFDSKPYNIEQSLFADNTEKQITPGLDSADEDQMDQANAIVLTEQFSFQQSDRYSTPLLNFLSDSVWQPPKRYLKDF